MTLLYTGANAPGAVQPQAAQSLGGYVSSSLVQNGVINNIFPDLSISDLRNGTIFTRMIVLKNTAGSIIPSLTIFSEFTSDEFELKMAGVLPAYDAGCARYYFEQLQNGNSIPFQASLEIRDTDNQIAASDIAIDAQIGLWISLSKKTAVTTTTTASLCSAESIEVLRADTETFKETDLAIKISY